MTHPTGASREAAGDPKLCPNRDIPTSIMPHCKSCPLESAPAADAVSDDDLNVIANEHGSYEGENDTWHFNASSLHTMLRRVAGPTAAVREFAEALSPSTPETAPTGKQAKGKTEGGTTHLPRAGVGRTKHPTTAGKFPRGTLIYDELGPATVMSCVDGYITARRIRCMPFVLAASSVDNSRKPFRRWSTIPVALRDPRPNPDRNKNQQP